MTKPRKKYTREFKISLIHLINSRTLRAKVVRENGIYSNLVPKWPHY